MTDETETVFRTIGEVSAELGLPQHILRYWETKFPQLRPVQRAGNRRYYRPQDIALARRIQTLLAQDGYTMKGVQKLLESGDVAEDGTVAPASPSPGEGWSPGLPLQTIAPMPDDLIPELRRLRTMLAEALAA